jgi:hypothetical protein
MNTEMSMPGILLANMSLINEKRAIITICATGAGDCHSIIRWNMMISLSLIVVLLVAAITAIGIGFRQRWLAVSAPSVFFGGLSYFFVGMYTARIKGIGHFFSVPFGGYSVTDSAITLSLICWVGIWAAVMHLIIPRWDKQGGMKRHGKVAWRKVALRTLLAVAPLGLTPVLGWLISEGWLNLGGGCKDIVMVLPWMAWSLVYFIVFVVLTVRNRSLVRSVAVSAGIATALLGVALAVLYVLSLVGIG